MNSPVFGDIKSRRLMIFKAILFVVMGIISGSLLVLDQDSVLRRVALLVICVWAFCRAYYFAFYVITAYLDPNFKYSGIMSAIRYLLKGRARNCSGSETDSPRNSG